MNKEEMVSRLSVIKKTAPITDEEIKYILNLFESLGACINAAYLVTEKDLYGDIYIDMYLNTCIDDAQIFDQIQNELGYLNELFDINYKCYSNHYFM